MTSTVDLHIHTDASDGQHSPADTVRMACEIGLRHIAITDHDTVRGVDEAVAAASGSATQVIAGVELSTDTDGLEVHLLGYHIDVYNEALLEALAQSEHKRLERADEIVRRLKALGVCVSWDCVQRYAGDGVVGRPHIAQAMLEARRVSSVQEAFDRYLGRGCPAYVERDKLTTQQGIRLVRQAGGVPVLAHPRAIVDLVRPLARAGLQGLEAHYSGYSRFEVECLAEMAADLGLLATGGSDFHGHDLGHGNALGQVHVPLACVEALAERKRLNGNGADESGDPSPD